MKYIAIKNWRQFQHYKERNPPWIKLHRELLNDINFMSLDLASRGLLLQLWILACEKNGQIPADKEELMFRLRLKKINLKPLLDKGFLDDACDLLADACPETEGEGESKGEERHSYGELQRVKLTDKEYATLLEAHGQANLNKGIEILDGYIASKNKKYASHYAVMKKGSWVWERVGGSKTRVQEAI